MRVLCADDDDLMHRTLVPSMTRAGYIVESAYNGRQAMEMLMEDPPDLLVLDSTMPELDGMGVLRQLKNLEGLRDIPVLMLSARKRKEDINQALENGACDYLTKPFSPNELLSRLKNITGI